MTISQPDVELTGGDQLGAESTDPVEFLLQREAKAEAEAQEESEEEAQDGEAEEEAEEVAEAQADPDEWLQKRRKVTINGEEVEISADEAFKGYMRDADYRQKTTKAAESTRQAEAERQMIRQERDQYVTRLDNLAVSLYRELVGDQSRLPELLDTDPVAYLRVKQDMDRKAAILQQAGQERQQLMQSQAADQQRETEAMLRREQEQLNERLPEWRDVKVRNAESEAISKYLRDIGYSEAEMNELQDHRALLVARDAMRYRAQQAVQKKQSQAPVTKSVAPQARQPQPQATAKLAELKKAAIRSGGKSDNLVAYLMAKDT